MNKSNDINELAHEGTLSFWIRRDENIELNNPHSNIQFMQDKLYNGIKFTVLKEKTFLRIIIQNPHYDEIRFKVDISEKLLKDIMVHITWNNENTRLYINGQLSAEQNSDTFVQDAINRGGGEILGGSKKGHDLVVVGDRIMISEDIKSDDWHQTRKNNMDDPASFATAGIPQAVHPTNQSSKKK